ncbi:MAG TPA: PQQ-binding-like beta-propeller repeat protein [Candidatus Paceibacterota bacterium]|nr:PQQ-binding-like beta-propeller repeat protein [Candidatus Paceibacterota bacterium]
MNGGPACTHSAVPPVSPPSQEGWRLLAWVAAVFSLLLGIGMAAGYWQVKTDEPLSSPRLKQLKLALREKPADENLKQQIRQLDLQLRQRYFRHLARTQAGVWLLLGGVAVFLYSVGRVRRGQKRLPVLTARTTPGAHSERMAALGRWSVAGAGAAVGLLLFGLSFGITSALPEKTAEIDRLLGGDAAAGAVAATPDAASPDELRRNWPRFLGINASFASCSNTPVSWDAATGEGILWKVPAPSAGFNSPIVWGDRVYFTGGKPGQLEVFCVDANTGQVAWRQAVANVPGSPPEPLDIPESTGYTAPSVATDGRRVYAIFANGDTAGFSLDGRLLWTRAFGALKNPYGHATSLITWQDRLLVQLDQGESEEGKSKLYALEGRSGRILWQRPRKVGGSWTTPMAVEVAGKAQVIALAVPWVISYSAVDGTELWRVDCLNGEVTPSPICVNGLVIAISPSDKMLAIRPDGQGDVTASHVVWSAEDNIPDVTSPASNGELIFTVTTSGLLTCFDARNGSKVWEHELDEDCHASPAIAGGRMYVFGQKGTAFVLEAGREYKELGRVPMGDSFHASPALVNDRIYLRGVSNLWCLGSGPSKLARQP